MRNRQYLGLFLAIINFALSVVGVNAMSRQESNGEPPQKRQKTGSFLEATFFLTPPNGKNTLTSSVVEKPRAAPVSELKFVEWKPNVPVQGKENALRIGSDASDGDSDADDLLPERYRKPAKPKLQSKTKPALVPTGASVLISYEPPFYWRPKDQQIFEAAVSQSIEGAAGAYASQEYELIKKIWAADISFFGSRSFSWEKLCGSEPSEAVSKAVRRRVSDFFEKALKEAAKLIQKGFPQEGGTVLVARYKNSLYYGPSCPVYHQTRPAASTQPMQRDIAEPEKMVDVGDQSEKNPLLGRRAIVPLPIRPARALSEPSSPQSIHDETSAPAHASQVMVLEQGTVVPLPILPAHGSATALQTLASYAVERLASRGVLTPQQSLDRGMSWRSTSTSSTPSISTLLGTTVLAPPYLTRIQPQAQSSSLGSLPLYPPYTPGHRNSF